jgi:hypothetical protein
MSQVHRACPLLVGTFVVFIFSPMCAGGFGQGPWLEAHGGSTYCAVAALTLMGKLGKSPLPAAVLRMRGPGSGAFLTPGSGMG